MITSMPRRRRSSTASVRRGAAVAGHEQRGADGNRGAHAGFAQVVAVPDAMRGKRDGIRAQVPERANQDGRGAHPVHVVVAVNEDRLAGANRCAESLDGLRHSPHRHRRMQLLHPRAQVVTRVVDRREPARHQEPGDQRLAGAALQ